jgi:hypothetical protein
MWYVKFEGKKVWSVIIPTAGDADIEFTDDDYAAFV